MKKKLIGFELGSLLLIVIGFVLMILDFYAIQLLLDLLIAIGLAGMVLSPIVYHVLMKRKTNIVIIYILIFLLLSLVRHYEFYYFLKDLYANLSARNYYTNFTIKQLVKYVLLICSLAYIAYVTLKIYKNETPYDELIKSKLFRRTLIIIAILIFVEMPIFFFQPDFAGDLHGHSIWGVWHIH